MSKIIRSICYFSEKPNKDILQRIGSISERLSQSGYQIQTKRICSSIKDVEKLSGLVNSQDVMLSVGTLNYEDARKQLPSFYSRDNLSFNVELSGENLTKKHTDILFEIIKNKPENTFGFTYVFNNVNSSPYFPSANYEKEGFSVGLQPTDLSDSCTSLEDWFEKMQETWVEINELFKNEKDFLGIDSSIAPLFEGKSSLLNFINKLGLSFDNSSTTDIYTRITNFIKTENPKPIGLCGLMLPCLEDFELAKEYEEGNFSIERNIYLSLHSGLGIDTYPIGVDESPENVLSILSLLKELSNKYKKPLSARFVSDGKAKIGDKTDFQNQYLKDVIVRRLR